MNEKKKTVDDDSHSTGKPDLIPFSIARSDESMEQSMVRERKPTLLKSMAGDEEKEGRVEDIDVNMALNRSLRYMGPIYYFFYGVWYDPKIGLDSDREVIVHYWIPRFWILYSFLVLFIVFDFTINVWVKARPEAEEIMINLLIYSAYFGSSLFAGCQQVYFGGHFAKSRCVERLIERSRRDLRDNFMKKRIIARLGLIHVITILIICLSALMAILSSTLGNHSNVLDFFSALPWLGPGIHLSLIWIWILWTRQTCIRAQIDEMEKDLHEDKGLDLETVKGLFDEFLSDAKDLSNEWAVIHMIRIFSAFGVFIGIVTQLDYEGSTRTRIADQFSDGILLLYLNFSIYFGIIWLDVIVTGYMNAAFYEDCVLSLLLNKNFDDNSSVVLPYLRRIMLGNGTMGYKILGRFITSAQAILVGTASIALFHIITSINNADN